MDGQLLEHLVSEKEKVLETAAAPGMKEVRGLENRLSSLEHLIVKASSLVKEQEEYAQVGTLCVILHLLTLFRL